MSDFKSPRKPEWLKSKKLGSVNTCKLTALMRQNSLYSVCEGAKCPNKGECFERGTATFMILGEICSRSCKFCAVNKTRKTLQSPDPKEPEAIALLVNKLKLKHVVVTTVTRDDLDDGGAEQFIKTVKAIRQNCNADVSVELLISDLAGDAEDLNKILVSAPDILGHNIETIERLYKDVREDAEYFRSLNVLKRAKEYFVKNNVTSLVKSGFMVGLGENREEVYKLMQDLYDYGAEIITIGQYLQPDYNCFPVAEYVTPATFKEYSEYGKKIGFKLVESGPLVRSSYHAEKARRFLPKYNKEVKQED